MQNKSLSIYISLFKICHLIFFFLFKINSEKKSNVNISTSYWEDPTCSPFNNLFNDIFIRFAEPEPPEAANFLSGSSAKADFTDIQSREPCRASF